MYLAQTNTLQAQAPFYVNILENIIANGEAEEKENIDFAIREAQDIANGQKEIFSVNNDYYFLITTLLTKFKDKLLALKGDNYDQKIYRDIIEILK